MKKLITLILAALVVGTGASMGAPKKKATGKKRRKAKTEVVAEEPRPVAAKQLFTININPPQPVTLLLDGSMHPIPDGVYSDSITAGRHNYSVTSTTGEVVKGEFIVYETTPAVIQVGLQPVGPVANEDGSYPYEVEGVKFNMVPVEGGTFVMGATGKAVDGASKDEKPAHQVTLSPYFIGQTEVTNDLWQAVMGSIPSQSSTTANYPVESVSWDDCQAFIQRLNEKTGMLFRLPTEAEWEFAARGGHKATDTKYAGGDDPKPLAHYNMSFVSFGSQPTNPVRTLAPNELGIYDMSGNVAEWCQDFKATYSGANQTDPTGPESGKKRVIRGGSVGDKESACRVSKRGEAKQSEKNMAIGLRLVLVAQ